MSRPLKRSAHVKLALMAGTALSLSACMEETESVLLYPSKQACVDAGALPPELCEAAFTAAQQAHQAGAPRYTSQDLCEEQFGIGQCAQGQGGQNSWLPFVAGIVIAELIDEIGDLSKASSPVYRGSSGGTYTPGGARVTRTESGSLGVNKTALSQPPQPKKVMTRTSVAARGGFGGGGSSGFGG